MKMSFTFLKRFIKKGVTHLSSFLLFILLTSNFFLEAVPEALYLTWQRHPESTMTICWITDLSNADNVIEFKKNDADEWQQANGHHLQLPFNTPYFIHTLELTQLTPSTLYHFKFRNDPSFYSFKTAPINLNQPIRFVAGGDMYNGDIEVVKATSRQAAQTSPLFALIGGDIAYAASPFSKVVPSWFYTFFSLSQQHFDKWLIWLKAWSQEMITPEGCLIPLLPALGNHDVTGFYRQTPAQSPFFYALFPMPGSQGYNVLDFNHYMSIFLLDSDHTHLVEGNQSIWLDKALKARINIPNKFALYHVPAYPSARKFTNLVSTKIRLNWVPLFDKYHLTAAFENHDHRFKRTYPLLNNRINPNGVYYFGDGAWGVKTRSSSKLAKKWYLAKTAQIRHFLLVDITNNMNKVSAISPNGEIFDEFSWQKIVNLAQ